jgi:hypothetical protein
VSILDAATAADDAHARCLGLCAPPAAPPRSRGLCSPPRYDFTTQFHYSGIGRLAKLGVVKSCLSEIPNKGGLDEQDESRPPFPSFTLESAVHKVRLAEDAWNTRDPERVLLAYTPGSRWRNRAEFVTGRSELDYWLIKGIWAYEKLVAVRFTYEWYDAAQNWFRSYGNEN